MSNNGFEEGKVYRLVSDNRQSYTPLVGVREEKLTMDSFEDYFTFFSLVHDIFAAQNMDDFSFQRRKIRVSDFLADESGLILTRPLIDVKRIWYDEKKLERGPLVRGWLENCGQILESFGCVRVEDIFRGERTWGCGDEAYRIFGDGSGSIPLYH